MVSPADLDVARKTLKLNKSNLCISFLSVLWKGEVLMCCVNNLDKAIMNIFCAQTLNEEDVYHLENLINNEVFVLDNR
jgi:hypothetical protein